jgi:hypothetical protein
MYGSRAVALVYSTAAQQCGALRCGAQACGLQRHVAPPVRRLALVLLVLAVRLRRTASHAAIAYWSSRDRIGYHLRQPRNRVPLWPTADSIIASPAQPVNGHKGLWPHSARLDECAVLVALLAQVIEKPRLAAHTYMRVCLCLKSRPSVRRAVCATVPTVPHAPNRRRPVLVSTSHDPAAHISFGAGRSWMTCGW